MFSPIEPFASGVLNVGEGNEIYWETSGNPVGRPALHVHGGPGGGMGAGYRRRYDPERFLVVGFEQRGCGRSRPRAGEALDLLSSNTTGHLIADIEALREHLGVEDWLVTGLSWGTTLALAWAQAHPTRVRALLLFAVTTTSRREVEWVTEEMGRIFPREWESFAEASAARPGERIVDAYARQLRSSDLGIRRAAIDAWCRWEDVHVSLDPNVQARFTEESFEFRRDFATLVTHYWSNSGFLDPPILERIDRIAHIPAVLIHGRLDVSGPLETSWRLHRAWPASELVVVENEGHGGERMIEELVTATARFADL